MRQRAGDVGASDATADDIKHDKTIRLLVEIFRTCAVDHLMEGNDVGCFSTDQYEAMYLKTSGPTSAKVLEGRKGWGRMHLESIRHYVVEVKPDVWVRRQDIEPNGA